MPMTDNAVNAQEIFQDTCQEGDFEVVCQMINEGIDVNFQLFGLRPIHVAASAGHYKIVDLLIKKGAKLNYRTQRTRKTAEILAKESGHDLVATMLSNASKKQTLLTDSSSEQPEDPEKLQAKIAILEKKVSNLEFENKLLKNVVCSKGHTL